MTTNTGRDPAVTSRMMARVRNKNSKAEIALRRALHAKGLRFRLHVKGLIGRPDIVLMRHRVIAFVDGDLWHGHAWKVRGLSGLEDLFPNRTEWWVAKIRANVERDHRVTSALAAQGWRVVRLWESDVLADPAAAADVVLATIRDADPAHRQTGRLLVS